MTNFRFPSSPDFPIIILPRNICPWCGAEDKLKVCDEFLMWTCPECGNIAIKMATTGAFIKGSNREKPPTIHHNDVPTRTSSGDTQMV